MLLDILEGAGNLFDLPGSMVRDAVTLNNPFDQLLSPIGSQNRMSGRDVLEHYGALSPNQEGLDFGDVAGGALGMAMDPLSYISGVGALKFLARGSKVDDVAKLIPKAGQAAARSATGTALVPYRNPLAEVLGMGDAQPLPTSGSVDPSAFLANAFGAAKESPLALPAPAAPFYSRLRRAVEALPDKPIKSQSLLNTLKKNPEGISMDEWGWSDMVDLTADNPSLTKSQILQHLDEYGIGLNRINLKPRTYEYTGPQHSIGDVEAALTKIQDSDYDVNPLTGGGGFNSNATYLRQDWRAVLKEMQGGGSYEDAVRRAFGAPDAFDRRFTTDYSTPASHWGEYRMPDGEDYIETLLQERTPVSNQRYEGGHFEEIPDVTAHLRTMSRDVMPKGADGWSDRQNVHFIDELQSDWHQAAKKLEKYHAAQNELTASSQQRIQYLNDYQKRKLKEWGFDAEGLEPGSLEFSKLWERAASEPGREVMISWNMPEDEFAVYKQMNDREDALATIVERLERNEDLSSVPASPFRNAWQDAGLKLALYDAAAKNSPGIGPSLPTMRFGQPTPAQLTARLSPPIALTAATTAEFTAASDVTSVSMNEARSP